MSKVTKVKSVKVEGQKSKRSEKDACKLAQEFGKKELKLHHSQPNYVHDEFVAKEQDRKGGRDGDGVVVEKCKEEV